MRSRIVRIDAVIRYSQSAINSARSALMDGGICIAPTARWYMFLCMAEDRCSLEKIFSAKGRQATKPAVLVAPSIRFVIDNFVVSPEVGKLMDNFWPGELFLELKPQFIHDWLKVFVSSTGHVLVNVSDDIVGHIACAIEAPLAATSVSFSSPIPEGYPGPAISLLEVQDFVDSTDIDVSVIFDGGISPSGNHSTVLRLHDDGKISITRQGTVCMRAIAATFLEEQ